MPAGAPLFTAAAVRGIFAGVVCGAIGYLAGRGALLESMSAVVAAALGGAALLLAVFVEVMRGGYAPILAEMRQTRAHLVELEVRLVLFKSSADAAHRVSRDSGLGTGPDDSQRRRALRFDPDER